MPPIGTDTLRSIEGIQGTNFADTYDATGYGTAGALNIGNNGTFNQFEGLGGNDIITGNGNTRVIYANAHGRRDRRSRVGHRNAAMPRSEPTPSPAASTASPVRPSATR